MNAIIRSISAYAPPRRVSNEELSKTMETSDEWIFSHTGIRYRHIAAEDEAASDLAVQESQFQQRDDLLARIRQSQDTR